MTPEDLAEAKDCEPLYTLMNQIRDLAPWEWMEETDLFGVKHPDTGETGFVSVMGMAGEYYAIAAYREASGLYGFWHIQDAGSLIEPEQLFNTPQLHAALTDRDMLEKRDYHLIKSLGLKYRGRSAWPQFRSYRNGYAPWYIEKYEADFLRYILEQVLVVAPRVREQPDILDPHNDHHYLVRVARHTGDGLTWEDKVLPVEEPGLAGVPVQIDVDLIKRAKRLPRGRFRVEADLFMLLTNVGKKDERPYFPYVLMLVDSTHDKILSLDILSPVPSIEQMWATIAPTVLEKLVENGSLPTEIRVRDNLLYGMVKLFANELNVNMTQAQWLPALDRMRVEMEHFMR
jgi:hypothetical protein